MTWPKVIPNGGCTCPICRVEQDLVLTLNGRASQRRFRKLAAGRRALAHFSSASDLVAHLHDRHRNGEQPRSPDQILRALIRARPSNGDHNLWQSVMVLAFVPTLHKTYRDVCVKFPDLSPEEIAQQALAAFLELAQSPGMACRKRYLSLALACGLRKTMFRWALREAGKSGDAERTDEGDADIREPVANGHFESSVLLDEFLSHCRREGILSTSDYQLLVEMKLQGYRAKEVTELAGRISASGIYQRLRGALLHLRGRALAKGPCRPTWSLRAAKPQTILIHTSAHGGYPHGLGVEGAWRSMVSPFSGRLALLDEDTDEFLKTIACLGGYCAAEQALRLGIARSPTEVLAHLRDLERAGFLRKVARYPVVYQVTKSTTRLLAMDLNARRPHPIETVRSRLLGASFYLEAQCWPAEFVFDHEQKIALFLDHGCPLHLLPRRSGQPYLWEEFVLRLADSKLGVALVDRYHRSAFLELWGLAQRFCACLEHLGDRLQLLIAVGSKPRYRLYGQLVGHASLQKLAEGRSEISVSLYRMQRPVLYLRTLLWPDGKPLEKM